MSESEALKTVADLMCLAARTAPKTRGVDVILTRVADEDDRSRLADEMERIAHSHGQAFFLRDAGNLRAAGACVLLAATSKRAGLKVCGFCGFESCAANEAAGAACAFNHMDLGIAASSAAAVAALHHADCRMMYTVGTAARQIDLFGDETISAVGIPLSATGKNPFFDRTMPELKKA
jgi:uncharacterized ferredoxin-like protein